MSHKSIHTQKTSQTQSASHSKKNYKIGVISDTHGLLREDVLDILRTCSAVLHGGDIHTQRLTEQLKTIAPFYAVRGNVDKDWASDIPMTLSIELFGIKIFMIHNKKQIKEDISSHNLIIYGHSHKFAHTQINGQTWLNPGSCGAKRFALPVTMAVIHTSGNGAFEIERIDLNPSVKSNSSPSAGDMKDIVICVMKEIDKGRPVEVIAKKCHITEELSNQICRLYLTHPGVNADGILKKMGL